MQEVRNCLVVRNTFASHRHSTWEEFKQVFTTMQLTDKHVKMREFDMTITFFNGSRIIFKGADSETKLLSLSNISDIWCEESYEIPENIIQQLFLRCRRNDLQTHFYFSFNPISRNCFMYDFINDPKTLEQGFVHKSTYRDNAFLSQDYIDHLQDLKRTNYNYYQIYAEGEFGNLGKTIFTNWEAQNLNIEELYTKGYTERIGCDLGWNDPSAVVVSLVDEATKTIYIVDEIYGSGMLVEQLADKMLEHNMAFKDIYFDSAEPRTIATMKKLGIKKAKPAIKGKDSVLAGLDLLQTYKIIVDSKCEHVIEDLANYNWKKDKATGEYLSVPDNSAAGHKFSHTIDALRYAFSPYLDKVKNIKTMNKALFGL